jgi:rhamnogalacturonyl hydrolase YesR
MISEVVERVARRAVSDRDALRPAPHWGDFVLTEGLVDVWEVSGANEYLDCARGIVDAYIDRGPDWGRIEWQWAGMALPALRLHRITDSRRYLDFGLSIVDRLRNRTRKTSDGGIVSHPTKPQLWIDLLYFSCPAFCEAALLTQDRTQFDAAVEQIKVFLSHLLDEATGLVYHVWDEETGQHSPCLWSRGNGWLTIACVETLARMPRDHHDVAFITEALQRQVEAICRHQDPSGHWHTVIDRPDSYIETSAAAIFGLGMVRGVRLGVLDRKYLAPAAAAWRALQDKVSHDGRVFDVSAGTPPGDFDSYQRITKGVETYGTGLFLQLGVDMSRL